MKRIKIEKLQPGDIILTARKTMTGKGVRFGTGGLVSHAMICVQYGSVIDSTSQGVHARNLQREFFNKDEDIFVLRVEETLPPAVIRQIIDFVRSEIGTRYSVAEAVRSVYRGAAPRNKRQFCSRLVARAYKSGGVNIVDDPDYCTPEDIRLSPLLIELTDITELASEEDLVKRSHHTNLPQMTEDAQNKILNVARALDQGIENFSDLYQMVKEHPEWDEVIANAYVDSGYLTIWDHERNANPWRYNFSLMESITDKAMLADLKASCVISIQEMYSGGLRYSVNLAGCKEMQRQHPRKTYCLLINLYNTLVQDDRLWRENSRIWLQKYHPGAVDQYMEWVEPHSELWFSVVDSVDPILSHLARVSMMSEQSANVCSTCGDNPVEDYRVANAYEAMPGVPSLRLCEDCVVIRRGYGELLKRGP